MLHTVIFIGPSGSGKGTQAGLLKDRIHRLDADKRQILYVETGPKFRDFIKGDNYSANLSKEVSNKETRQPDFLACWLWGEALVSELKEDMHLVFDGAPRSLPEAMIMNTAITFYNREKPAVIYINVSRKWSEERLLGRGRLDDRDMAKINERLNWFEEDTRPALEYFKKNNLYKFIEINGEQPIEKVHADIVAAYEYKD